jgi:PPK2 family polyphosphate:nucleotide phosphotransferase
MHVDLSAFRIVPGTPVRLAERDPAGTQGLTEKEHEDAAKAQVEANVAACDALQERLYAENRQALLLVLQAMDGGGKDSTLRRVFGPLDPQGVRVAPFKAPTEEELAHDFLWRVHAQAPRKGELVVFNRSHYEDVLIVRVHDLAPPDVIERRYDHIVAFERLLHDAGTRVVKVMLHISKAYQLERMRRRLERPDKHWKFNPGDLKERERWDDYMRAFEIALERTSTETAPWYVVAAEERWFRDLAVSQLLRETLEAMDPQYPPPTFNPADYPPDALR